MKAENPFKKDDVVKFKNRRGYWAKEGSLAIVVSDPDSSEFIDIKWLEETRVLSDTQRDGTYYVHDFTLNLEQ